MMGNQPGKQMSYPAYDVSDSESDVGQDVVQDQNQAFQDVEHQDVDVVETQGGVYVEEAKKRRRRRRGRRGKKEVPVQVVEETTTPTGLGLSPFQEAVKEEVVDSINSMLDVDQHATQPAVKPAVEPATPHTTEYEKKPKKEKKKKVKEETNDIPVVQSKPKQEPKQKPKPELKKKREPKPVPPEHLVKTVPHNELTEEKKKELSKINGPSQVKADDRTCFACKKMCISRHQLNHHYGMCQAFPKAYESMKPDDRSWYMMIQYVRDDMKKASCLCMGCGVVFKKRSLMLEHNVKCRKAMDIDTWDRLTCFGLLFGTPYDDFLKFLPKYKERKTVPEYVSRVHRFVEDVKAAILKEKADEVIKETRMKVVEEKAVKSYVEAVLQKDTMGSTIGFGSGIGASVSAGVGSAAGSGSVTGAVTGTEKPAPEDCPCSRCKNAHVYPPVPHSDVWGPEKEGYFIIPMTLDGYTTVLNGRTIHIPTQNVMLRIHDVAPA